MMQDEIKRKLDELEKRIIILEGGEIKPAPVKVKLKPVEALAPKLGVTTDPFGGPVTTGPRVVPKEPKAITTTENVKEEILQEVVDKILPGVVETMENDNSKTDDEKDVEAELVQNGEIEEDALDKKPLDIDPLDRYLKDEKLEEKYGDRVEEAKKLIAELDNDEE